MTKEFDFGKNLKELEEITAWFESDEVDLDLALEKFERGMTLSAELKDHLKVVETKVTKIKQRFDGQPIPSAEEASTDATPDLFS